ncbi:MAG: apolipoprotein N-acyltransferase, partial [Desulfobacterales bacterium]|nr:apolipoprotein N-acyltransferase [Desulfobacterales bacterium]
ALFAAPFLWVALEYARSNLSFLALSWGLLAHSQYQNPLLIQITSITGTYGLSFLIVLVNAAITALLIIVLSGLRKTNVLLYESTSKITGKFVILAAAVCLVATLVYGYLQTSEAIIGKKIKISLVQGNIDQTKKWDRKYANFIMKTYADLTIEASKDRPGLIVWPETATPRSVNLDGRLNRLIRNIVKSANSYLLLGSSEGRKFKGTDPKNLKYFNSAFLFPPDTEQSKIQRYNKIRLFPFGEYLPYKKKLPWSFINVPNVDHYLPGKEYTVFNLPDYRFAVTICWENIFPDLVRQFVRRDAQFIINITNEAWVGETAAPYHFLAMNVFRAVENRVYVVRCANTGVSCFIDPLGRITARLEDTSGQDIFVRGVLSGHVIPLDSETFYTRYGDWIVILSIMGSIAFLVIAMLRKN